MANLISIHVPAWGTTYTGFLQVKPSINFNPRSRVGNDIKKHGRWNILNYFNPRSRVGNDSICLASFWSTVISIHVPAWGTTMRSKTIGGFYFNFNPRSRVGNDIQLRSLQKIVLISIHVPAWGTTWQIIKTFYHFFISIHVPAWGTTNCNLRIVVVSCHFNPRSRVGNDRHH